MARDGPRGLRDGILEEDALGRERVDVRGRATRIPVGGEVVGARRVHHDPENVGLVDACSRASRRCFHPSALQTQAYGQEYQDRHGGRPEAPGGPREEQMPDPIREHVHDRAAHEQRRIEEGGTAPGQGSGDEGIDVLPERQAEAEEERQVHGREDQALAGPRTQVPMDEEHHPGTAG